MGRLLTQTRSVLKDRRYLEIPNGHGSIDASSAKFATILLVHLVNRHLTEKRQRQERDCEAHGGSEPCAFLEG